MRSRVAIIAHSIDPVKQRHLIDWYDALKRECGNVALFVGSLNRPLVDARRFKVGSRFGYVWAYCRSLLRGRKMPKDLLRLMPLVEYAPNLIHLLTVQVFNTVRPLLANDDIKLIASFRGFDLNVFPYLRKENMEIIREVFQRSTYLHFISTDLKNKAIALGASPEKCVVIHRSFDPGDSFLGDSLKGNPSRHNVLLTVGRLVWEKGYLYALEALAVSKRRGYEFTYYIVGDGVDRNQLIYHTVRLDLRDRVVMTGQLDREGVKEMLLKATIYLQPSISEGLCNAVMEASYYELPIVAFRTGGIPEIVEQGHSGLMSDTYDVNGLVRDLQSLLDNPDLRKRLGQNAHDRIVTHFKRSDEIARWLELYRALD